MKSQINAILPYFIPRTIHSTLPYLWCCSFFGDIQHWNVKKCHIEKLTSLRNSTQNKYEKIKNLSVKSQKILDHFLARIEMQHKIRWSNGFAETARSRT